MSRGCWRNAKNEIDHLYIWVSYSIVWWSTSNWKTHRLKWHPWTEKLLNLNFSGRTNIDFQEKHSKLTFNKRNLYDYLAAKDEKVYQNHIISSSLIFFWLINIIITIANYPTGKIYWYIKVKFCLLLKTGKRMLCIQGTISSSF